VASVPSIGNINPLFSLFHQEKKEIHDAAQLWGIRNLTDFRRHAQNCSFLPVSPAKFQPPGMPITSIFWTSVSGTKPPLDLEKLTSAIAD